VLGVRVAVELLVVLQHRDLHRLLELHQRLLEPRRLQLTVRNVGRDLHEDDLVGNLLHGDRHDLWRRLLLRDVESVPLCRHSVVLRDGLGGGVRLREHRLLPVPIALLPRVKAARGSAVHDAQETKAMRRIVAALVVLAAACSGSQKVPDKVAEMRECNGPLWTCFKSGPCPLPELKDSLCAVGTADQIVSYNLGMQAASTRARTEMGAVIRSKVDGFTRATQDGLSKAGGADEIQKVSDLAQNVVDQTLHGVAVPRTFFDKETKVYFALAVIDAKTFVGALKGLKEAKGISDAVKQEIEVRAEKVVDEWKAERERNVQ